MPKPNKVVPADDQQLRQQFKRIDDHHHANGEHATSGAGAGGTLRERFAATWRTLHVKSALAHVGLLVSLSIYCAVGGYVRNQFIAYQLHRTRRPALSGRPFCPPN